MLIPYHGLFIPLSNIVDVKEIYVVILLSICPCQRINTYAIAKSDQYYFEYEVLL